MASDSGGMTGKATGELGETSGLYGTWQLEVKTPFGQHPATLNLQPDDTGNIDSKLGNVPLENLATNGDSFNAKVAYSYQGRTYTAKITGHVEGHNLNGQINVDFPMAPAIKFMGEKQ
ncbi:MAG: hypothetical protein M3371_09295 [Acidobacteriota bacterium]|nr:hypothetical protein [Acidobacteriota bacterium]